MSEIFQQEKQDNTLRITKGESKRNSAAGLSTAPIQALSKKKKGPTAGNWTGCFKSVQTRTKQDEKYILCERRAGRKPDTADDQRADMKVNTDCRFSDIF